MTCEDAEKFPQSKAHTKVKAHDEPYKISRPRPLMVFQLISALTFCFITDKEQRLRTNSEGKRAVDQDSCDS